MKQNVGKPKVGETLCSTNWPTNLVLYPPNCKKYRNTKFFPHPKKTGRKNVLNSQSAHRPAPKVYQRLEPRLNLKPRSIHFAHPSPNFYGVKSANLALWSNILERWTKLGATMNLLRPPQIWHSLGPHNSENHAAPDKSAHPPPKKNR